MNIYKLQEFSKGNEPIFKEKLHPMQDFIEGQLFYGLKSNELINSSGEIIPLEGLKKKYDLVSESLEESRFPDALKNFTINDYKTDPKNLILEIIDLISTYLQLHDKRYYTLLALYVMDTYIYKVFSAFPYLHFQAMMGSGKTRALKILESICFNGYLSSSLTASYLKRFVHKALPTLLIDEAEKLRFNGNDSMVEILKGGYDESGKVNLTDIKDYNKSIQLTSYSPKVLAGTEPINLILKDRTITIPIYRSTIELDDFSIKNSDIKKRTDLIKANLYLFGLKYAKNIQVIYHSLKFDEKYSTTLNRQAQLWFPLIALARLIDNSKSKFKEDISQFEENIFQLCKEDLNSREINTENESLQISLGKEIVENVLSDFPEYDCKQQERYVVVDTQHFFDGVKGKEIIPDTFLKTTLTRFLMKYNLATVWRSNGKVYYRFDRDHMTYFRMGYLSHSMAVNGEY